MESIRKDFENRSIEIYEVLNFIEIAEKNNVFAFPQGYNFDKVRFFCSLRASLIIMLYNVVEFVITKCLSRIHSEFNKKNLQYHSCNHDVKQLLLRYYISIIKDDDIEKSSESLLTLMEHLHNNEKINLSFEEFSKKESLYSGNLDSRLINKIFSKYGLELNLECSELKTIKDIRNKLAHGEESFEEIGRNLTTQYLRNIAGKSFTFMESVMVLTSTYLNTEQYKASVEHFFNG